MKKRLTLTQIHHSLIPALCWDLNDGYYELIKSSKFCHNFFLGFDQ